MFFWQFIHNVTWHTVAERFCSNLFLMKRSLFVSLDNLLISGKHFQSNVEVKDRVKLKYYLLLESKLKVVSLHNKLKVYATLELSERVSGQRFLNLHLSKGRFRVILFPQLRNIPFELFPWMLCTFLFCELSNSYTTPYDQSQTSLSVSGRSWRAKRCAAEICNFSSTGKLLKNLLSFFNSSNKQWIWIFRRRIKSRPVNIFYESLDYSQRNDFATSMFLTVTCKWKKYVLYFVLVLKKYWEKTVAVSSNLVAHINEKLIY